jgi:nitric oxide reductase NorD protein
MTDHDSAPPLSANELRRRMEAQVERVMSLRRSVEGPAEALAGHPRAVQERFLQSVTLIARNSIELGYNFCAFGVPAVEAVEPEDWHAFTLHIMDRYDQGGVMASINAMRDVDSFASFARRSRVGVSFASVVRVLEPFVTGLAGRPLKLVSGEEVYTDTETLHLPEVVAAFPERNLNFQLFKAMAVHQWAQTWFGTWHASLHAAVEGYPDPERALRLLHALETLRLDACIARELPGVHREMHALREAEGMEELPAAWRPLAARLSEPGAALQDSLALLERAYAQGLRPLSCGYQGELFPDRTEPVIAARKRKDAERLKRALRRLLDEHDAAHGRQPDLEPEHGARRLDTAEVPDPERPGEVRIDITLDGVPLAPPDDVRETLDSIVQDLGHVPPDYLVPAGHGAYDPNAPAASGAEVAGAGSLCYDEWDHVRKKYRKDWCLLKERDVFPAEAAFVADTLARHRGTLKHLRRTFEALRGEDKRLRRQPFGDEVDIDAVVASHADRLAGLEGSDRLFSQHQRVERNIAVMFMVDMSGSTKGWINDLEREALVLLCESLELLGDRYAIYGFSSYTHKRCEQLRIKRFDEPYDAAVRGRIAGIKPQEYTRMGVAIRHLTGMLNAVDARTRLLVVLSDGRPDDMDGYRGTYGIEDTRQALIEARAAGVHPYCITIDDEAMDYLPHMFGPAGFTVISQVEKLPYRVSDIYRRITT